MLTKLRAVLFEQNRSQKWLASRARISTARLCRLIRGQVRLRAHERRRISSVLAVSPWRLFPRFRQSRKRQRAERMRVESEQ